MNRNLAFVAIIYDRIGTRIKDVFENDAGNNLAQFFNLNPGAESLLTQLEHVDTEEQINAPPNVGLVIRDVIDSPISELLEKLEDHDSPLEFGNRLQTFFQQYLSFLRESRGFQQTAYRKRSSRSRRCGKGIILYHFLLLRRTCRPRPSSCASLCSFRKPSTSRFRRRRQLPLPAHRGRVRPSRASLELLGRRIFGQPEFRS